MSRNKKKRAEIEAEQAEIDSSVIKEYKERVRTLEKRVKRLSKDAHRVEDLEELVKEDTREKPHKKDTCECGFYRRIINLGPKTLAVCDNCKKRELL